ncbi:FAD-dependent oxidoreductase [Halovivax limisalsi]|uniref:FAD-dependent oxidoreductase n=1 Tax=Halovivax limisalsi TaxID=1453760 RepID=UPI001FFD6E7B|nr:FAD-dependent oxidoreductase [Halovivax limisalsi]
MADDSSEPESPPGRHTSPWLADFQPSFEPLSESTSTDVVVVGAGIAGLSTAAELAVRGYDVVVLERDRIAGGTTGRSTAKVTSQHGLLYRALRGDFGIERARQYADANERAIATVAERVEALDRVDDCGFRRRPAYVYGDDRGAIEREVEAARSVGLPASLVTSVPPYEAAECGVRFDDQACFDPACYLRALAAALVDPAVDLEATLAGVDRDGDDREPGAEDGDDPGEREGDPGDPVVGTRQRGEVSVHESTRVEGVDPGASPRVGTPAGTVTAEYVVLATGFPLLDRVGLFARLVPKRSYVLALRIDGDPPDGMYYRPPEGSRPYRSVRTHEGPDETLVLVGGENHKTGQGGSTRERYRRLREWAETRFDVREVAYRWSTQDYVSADRIPLVGPAGPGARNVFLATGFGGWGMTGGTVSGSLLARSIDGEDPPLASLYDPRRFTPSASIGRVASENADVAGQFATDWLRALLRSSRPALDPGEGTVVREGGRPVAISRDESGTLRAVSAVCPHARCVVDWNDGEGTWDCPCHGSRFEPDGRVIEGPATDELPSEERP